MTRRIGRRHPLMAPLLAQGFTVHEAWTVLNAIFDAMKGALQRHEAVELPFGTLRVVRHTVTTYRRWWRGRPVEFYRNPYRIEFVPFEDEEAER